MIIQIIGLPGAGKTTLATALADRINAIHFNAVANVVFPAPELTLVTPILPA